LKGRRASLALPDHCRPVATAARTAQVPLATVKRFHVTTFGCQMNEHDSERIKGMLESLGYDEARSLKRRAPETVIGVGGCWAQSVKEEVFQRFPFVDVAFGPGQVHKLAEFLTSESLTAQGFFEFEAFTAELAA